MQSREFIARRFQLNRRSVGGEIADVGPIENFNRLSRAGKAGGCEASPESLKTHVSSGYTPIAGSFDDLHVVDANDAFAVDVDQLFVEHIAREQDFTFATHERTKIENV